MPKTANDKFKTVGFIHAVDECLNKTNHELIDKMNKYAAPSYMLVILHNAMELMLKDYLLSRGVNIETSPGKSLGPKDLINEVKEKIPYIKQNLPKFVEFNKRRNDVYHRTALVPRIENLKDDYRLLIGLYKIVYKKKFFPTIPFRYTAYALISFYSFFLAIGSSSSFGSYAQFVILIGFLIFPTSLMYIFFYMVNQKELNGYFPLRILNVR
jgi:hypothetical protein